MTFANLPQSIEKTIAAILQQQETSEWVHHARDLHIRYTKGKTNYKKFIHDYVDALAYLGLRVPATYAQVFGVLNTVQEMIPLWRPTSLLDIGSGPGTATWAAISLWQELNKITCIDENRDFTSLGKQIIKDLGIIQQVNWKNRNLSLGIEEEKNSYDLVIISNVLNELHPIAQEKLIGQAFNCCNGLLIIIEPGTPRGSQLVSSIAQKLSKVGILLAPYIANTFVEDEGYYLHFPQRFIRPDFQRRIRQQMRENSEVASDWEESKYSYVVISKFSVENNYWARIVGETESKKGFLEVPVITRENITKIKVMKRDKEAFTFAKRLRWGMPIANKLLQTLSFS
ncbi:MAG TPA: small ribosomal subunit Rsm22 family protein [Candidatus Sulfotelmatobacter sp.]|jgi:ribosomal protein RSM22 (predicted rRNA methylase)|nr:small ribosomal subunit Rsm22 family protein [Candidatus Sulfotelmatobacter sp.]